MSDGELDLPEGEREGDSPVPANPPNRRRKWFVALAAVTATAVGLAGIGLAATSQNQSAKSQANDLEDIGTTVAKSAVRDLVKGTVGPAIVSSGVGFAVQLGLKSLISAFGGSTESEEAQETLKLVKEISSKLDAVSAQLTDIKSQLGQLSVATAEIRDQIALETFERRDGQVQAATKVVKELFETYQQVLCAHGAEFNEVDGTDTTGTLYDRTKCPLPAAEYESQFKQLFNNPQVAGTYQELHEQVMATGTVPSILTDFARVYVGQRRYFSRRDSVAIRNYYTNISEQAALAAYMEAEYKMLAGRPESSKEVMTNWLANDRAEQGVLPPLLPLGFVIHIPKGVGPAGAAYPAVVYTAPFSWGSTPTEINFPNERSASGVGDAPPPIPLRLQPGVWHPSVVQDPSIPWFNYGPGNHAVGDFCSDSNAGKGCLEGEPGYQRTIDNFANWGNERGWRVPTGADVKALSSDLGPAVFPETGTDSKESKPGNVGAKLGYLASGVRMADVSREDSDSRLEPVFTGFGFSGVDYPHSIWIAETSSFKTLTFYADLFGVPNGEASACQGTWTRHQYVNLDNGVVTPTGPRSTELLPKSQTLVDQMEEVRYSGFPSRGDEQCALGAVADAPEAGFLKARNLTASKGDDFLAQNAMSAVWPVVPPSAPRSVSVETDNGAARVTWTPPESDGGSPISYRNREVTATPLVGRGSPVTCAVYELALCLGLENGVPYVFRVRVTNDERLSAEASATGTPQDPATTSTSSVPAPPAPAPSTATTSAGPTSAAPAPPATTSPAPANRDASKNVEAESFDGQCSGCSGVVVKASDGWTSGGYIGGIATGDWVRFEGVNTPAGSDAKFELRVASGSSTTGTIELRADSPTGPVLASVPVSNTGGWKMWTTLTVPKQSTLGSRSTYMVFKSKESGDFVNVDWFKFTG